MKVTQFLTALLFLFTTCFNLNAQEKQTLLWKIEGNDIQASYLYGTIHVLPQEDFELKEKVKTAFEDSEVLVLELDFDDPTLQLEMMKHVGMKDGQTLDKLLDKETYQELDSYLKQNVGAGMQAFNNWKPFMLSTLLIGKYIEGQPASFEGSFTQMAMADGKEILGLESVAEQLAIFDEIPYEEQIGDLEMMLDEEEKVRKLFQEMILPYKNEDYESLYNMTREYYNNDQTNLDLLLHKRNHNWISKIGELAKEKSAFFGVGAAHLGGKEGVINLLKEAGYTLTPLL
jgi:uncharacterized protein YbaP (TraB family)